MLLSASVTPAMPWSLSTGRLMTASQTCVSVRHTRLPALPKVARSSSKPNTSLPKHRRPEPRSAILKRARSRSEFCRSQMTISVIPACRRRSHDGLHQLRVRGVAPASQAIHLQPHHLARAHDLLPRFEGRVAVEGSLQGAVEQLGEPRGVETRPGAANFRVASNDHAGAARFGEADGKATARPSPSLNAASVPPSRKLL